MRLDKYLNEALSLTRAKCVELIRNKKVFVNGEVCKSKDYDVKETDLVKYDGNIIKLKGLVYKMINKGQGVVCSKDAKDGKPIYDFIEDKDINPIGRLDKDTTGLIIITNDGEMIHKITSPKSHVEKEYIVTVAENIKDSNIEILKEEHHLSNGKRGSYIAISKSVKKIDENTLSIVIEEGKYHEIKELVYKAGLALLTLKRVRIGNIKLDIELKENEIRDLNEEEVEYLKAVK